MKLEDFRAEYPEFEKVPDTAITRRLTMFDAMYKGDYGDMRDMLQGLYTAHYLKSGFNLKNGKSSAGDPNKVLTSMSEGGVSLGYTLTGTTKNNTVFSSTTYGQEFESLLPLFGLGPMLAG